MDPPRLLIERLQRDYPRPTVDLVCCITVTRQIGQAADHSSKEWLKGCYDYIVTEKNFNPTTDMEQIIREVNRELLGSNLCDSMVPGTGFPDNVNNLDGATIPGPPILVEIAAMDEEGHSVFSLLNAAEERAEHAKREARRQAAVEAGDEEEEEEEDPKPVFPRSMLRLDLSDGTTTLRGFEYRRLPDIELGETPIGFKVSIPE